MTACSPALGLPGFCGRNSLAFPLEGGVLLFYSILVLLAKHLALRGLAQSLCPQPPLAGSLGGQPGGAVPEGQPGAGRA